jgi:hypothetical protein
MISKAYEGLYGEPCPYETRLRYSRAFSGFNANIRLQGNLVHVRMSREWKDVSKDIQVGLIQLLLTRLLKRKGKVAGQTMEMEMYIHYLKNLSKYTQASETDPDLEASYHRVNEVYFDGFIDRPNLVWGNENFYKLGTYTYATNTVTISSILAKDENLLDYVMYHELLHKKLQFYDKNGRTFHHTRKFKEMEGKYKDADAERKLQAFLRKQKRGRLFKWW